MTENNEFDAEELPEEDFSETPSEEVYSEVDADSSEILVDEPEIEAADIPPHPEASLSETPEEAPAIEEELAEVKEPTRFQLFLRRALIWFGVALAFFAAGFATFYFVLYQPKMAELEDLQAQIIYLEADVEDLESEIADLTAELEDTAGELDSVTSAIEDAEKHKALMMVMVDAYDARYALGEENIIAAKSALSGTDATLDLILEDISSFDSGLADTLPQRLALIRTNLDRDTETAVEDCNQLIEDLLAVEAALYP